MKERPILFSGEMVRAILDGRKPQTRRVIKPPPEHRADGWHVATNPKSGYGSEKVMRDFLPIYCPYGQPGDKLWVRETFVVESSFNSASAEDYPPPFKDGRPIKWTNDDEYGEYWEQCHYRATDLEPELHYGLDEPGCKWRPSIFMPRWASRITLEVTGVRVERVQDISEGDAQSEGVPVGALDTGVTYVDSYVESFMRLWDCINGKRPGCAWEDNPWVWVVEFQKV
jgi:hypothetical protein